MTALSNTITRAEFKAQFGIGETTLCKWIKQGVVPAPIRMGRCTVWFPDAVEKTLDALRRRSEKNLRK